MSNDINISGGVGVGKNTGTLNVNQIQSVSRNPSVIAKLISVLSEKITPAIDNPPPSIWKEYDIDEKIQFNAVTKYRDLIYEYSQYGAVVESSYQALDGERPDSRKKILFSIHDTYRQAIASRLGALKSDASREEKMVVIRKCSDLVIDEVVERIKKIIIESSEGPKINIEDINTGVSILVAHAFIECKVLEHPKT